MKQEEQEGFVGDFRQTMKIGLWLAAVLPYLALCTRVLRGPEGTPLSVKLVGGMFVLPVLHALGGGGHPLLYLAVHGTLVIWAVSNHFKARADLATGRLEHSRSIGLPFLVNGPLFRGRLTEAGAYRAEVAMWLLAGFAMRVVGEPGLGFLFLVFGCTCWIERAVVNRAEEAHIRDSLDAMRHQRAMAEEIQRRMTRRHH